MKTWETSTKVSSTSSAKYPDKSCIKLHSSSCAGVALPDQTISPRQGRRGHRKKPRLSSANARSSSDAIPHPGSSTSLPVIPPKHYAARCCGGNIHTMSGLRILVPVKRVIDYAVRSLHQYMSMAHACSTWRLERSISRLKALKTAVPTANGTDTTIRSNPA